MDSITLIVTALTAGVGALAQSAVADAYGGLKSLITQRYRSVNVDLLEGDPASEARRAVVAEDLRSADADADTELLERVRDVLRAVEREAVSQPEARAVDLDDIRAASLQVQRILAEGPGASAVKAHGINVDGAVEISDVTARAVGDTHPKA